MDPAAAILATSYAPGHDFWRGEPWEWWLRGSIRFALMNVTTFALTVGIFLKTRRGDGVRILALWLPLTLLGCYLTDGLVRYRDSDMPTAIGHRRGVHARLPLMLFAVLIGLRRAGVWGRRRKARGFEVVSAAEP